MSSQSEKPNNLPVSPISLVKEIQSGQISAKSLPKEPRQICVEYLTHEGFSADYMAEILNWDEKTKQNYISEFKEDLKRATVFE